jgi:Flp pilus assembly protein TadD
VQGQTRAAQQQFAVAEASARLAGEAGVRVDLELALFLTDHGDPAQALNSARASWRARQTVHTADALAWALHANGQDGHALRYARQATRLGTTSPQFLHHLGAIEASLGRERAASTHLTAALSADPGYSPWQRQRVADELRRLQSAS